MSKKGSSKNFFADLDNKNYHLREKVKQTGVIDYEFIEAYGVIIYSNIKKYAFLGCRLSYIDFEDISQTVYLMFIEGSYKYIDSELFAVNVLNYIRSRIINILNFKDMPSIINYSSFEKLKEDDVDFCEEYEFSIYDTIWFKDMKKDIEDLLEESLNPKEQDFILNVLSGDFEIDYLSKKYRRSKIEIIKEKHRILRKLSRSEKYHSIYHYWRC